MLGLYQYTSIQNVAMSQVVLSSIPIEKKVILKLLLYRTEHPKSTEVYVISMVLENKNNS